jgi:DNA-binding transcriptional ArsR family regulator
MSDGTPNRDLGETLGETEPETPEVPHGNALPLTAESVVRLVDEEGLSYSQAGERLGVSRSTVYRRLKKARAESEEEESGADRNGAADRDDLRDLRGLLEDREEPDDWNCGTCGAPVGYLQGRCRCGTALDWSAV